jgi:outer membrane protein assembly factor BamB/PKD repeat protein
MSQLWKSAGVVALALVLVSSMITAPALAQPGGLSDAGEQASSLAGSVDSEYANSAVQEQSHEERSSDSAVDTVEEDNNETASTVQSSANSTAEGMTVYVGSDDDHVYALDAETGEQQWSFETGGKVQSSPTVVNGTVYIGSIEENVYAIDADTGEQQWSFETGHGVFSSPTVVNGTVYVGSDDENVYAIDADTGEQQWSFETGFPVTSSPTVVNGTVYVGSRDDNVYAIDADTGEQQWSFETGDNVHSSPTVVDGTVYVGSEDENVYAIDADTGEQQWSFETGGSGESSPTVVNGTVYVGSDDENVYAIDADTGEQQWSFETGHGVFSSPTVVDGTVYVGSRDVYAIDADTGEQQWSSEIGDNETGDYVYSSPTVVDGTVYVGSWDENVYAIDAKSGEQQWSFGTGDGVLSSPTVVANPESGSSIGSRVLLRTLGHHEGSMNNGSGEPAVNISVETPDPSPDKQIEFRADLTNANASNYEFQWDFENHPSHVSESPTVEREYDATGTYDVSVEARPISGDAEVLRDSRQINITEPGPAPVTITAVNQFNNIPDGVSDVLQVSHRDGSENVLLNGNPVTKEIPTGEFNISSRTRHLEVVGDSQFTNREGNTEITVELRNTTEEEVVVRVRDENGNPIRDATVSGDVSGDVDYHGRVSEEVTLTDSLTVAATDQLTSTSNSTTVVHGPDGTTYVNIILDTNSNREVLYIPLEYADTTATNRSTPEEHARGLRKTRAYYYRLTNEEETYSFDVPDNANYTTETVHLPEERSHYNDDEGKIEQRQVICDAMEQKSINFDDYEAVVWGANGDHASWSVNTSCGSDDYIKHILFSTRDYDSKDDKSYYTSYGILAHELGHAVYDWEDYYSYNQSDSGRLQMRSKGLGEIGQTGLMAYGATSQKFPAEISAYHQYQEGWVEPSLETNEISGPTTEDDGFSLEFDLENLRDPNPDQGNVARIAWLNNVFAEETLYIEKRQNASDFGQSLRQPRQSSNWDDYPGSGVNLYVAIELNNSDQDALFLIQSGSRNEPLEADPSEPTIPADEIPQGQFGSSARYYIPSLDRVVNFANFNSNKVEGIFTDAETSRQGITIYDQFLCNDGEDPIPCNVYGSSSGGHSSSDGPTVGVIGETEYGEIGYYPNGTVVNEVPGGEVLGGHSFKQVYVPENISVDYRYNTTGFPEDAQIEINARTGTFDEDGNRIGSTYESTVQEGGTVETADTARLDIWPTGWENQTTLSGEKTLSIQNTGLTTLQNVSVSTDSSLIDVSAPANGTVASGHHWNVTLSVDEQVEQSIANHQFNVTVTGISGSSTESSTRTLTADLEVPESDLQAGIDANTTEPLVGDTLRFDATDSTVSDGDIVSYEWDIDGDGSYEQTTDAPTLDYSYETAGDYAATVRVTDDTGATDTATIMVTVQDRPTIPEFSLENPAGQTLRVELTADKQLANLTVDIAGPERLRLVGVDFTETTQNGTYAYEAEVDVGTDGEYTATLVSATDTDGIEAPTGQSASATVRTNNAPMAELTTPRSEVAVGESVQFNATASSDDGALVSYEWDVDGDGSYEQTTDAPTFEYSYEQAGTYNVTVRVTDDAGGTDTATQPITVSSAELPEDAVAFLDADGSGSYDAGEQTYTASALSQLDVSGSLVIARNTTTDTISISATEVTVHDGVSLEATQGSLTLSATQTATLDGADIRSSDNIDVTTEGGPISAVRTAMETTGGEILLDAGGDVHLENADLQPESSGFYAYGYLSVSAGGDITADDASLTADGYIEMSANGGFTAESATVEGSMGVTLTTNEAVSLNATDVTTEGRDINITAGGALTAPNSTVEVSSYGHVVLDSAGDMQIDNATVRSAESFGAGGNVTVSADGELAADGSTIEAAVGLSMSAADGASAEQAEMTANGEISVTAGSQLSLTESSLSSTPDTKAGTVSLAANGDLFLNDTSLTADSSFDMGTMIPGTLTGESGTLYVDGAHFDNGLGGQFTYSPADITVIGTPDEGTVVPE